MAARASSMPTIVRAYTHAVSLADFGWDERFAQDFATVLAVRLRADAARADLQPGRVVIEFNHNYRVATEAGEIDAVLAGRVKHHATSRAELPAVGDWVVIRRQAD